MNANGFGKIASAPAPAIAGSLFRAISFANRCAIRKDGLRIASGLTGQHAGGSGIPAAATRSAAAQPVLKGVQYENTNT